LKAGCEVVAVDNFYSSSRQNLAGLIDNPRFELIRHDITFPLYIEIDEVYNLACPASPVHYQRDPVQTIKTNVHGTINMLGLAKRTKSRFFQASTSEVYGDPEIHPQREDYWGHVNPLGPRACYDEGKRCAESLCMSYHQQHGMTLRMARIFNTYGPRMHPNDGRVVSNFIVAALRDAPIEIYGDGSQTRSFCYVDDMIEGFIALMALETFEGPVNLGRPHEVTVRQLAEQVIALTGSRSKIVHKPSPADDPLRRLPDIALARRLLNWEPKTGLDQGLAKTTAYFEGILSEQ
jgi:UDP-glucuronate decarboxylase